MRFFLTILLVLISFCPICYGLVQDVSQNNPNSSEPQYAPNEVIVKFKGNINPQSVLPKITPEMASVSRVYSIGPAVSKFRKDYTLERNSGGWYSFLGTNYKEAADIPDEELFKEAYKTMPEQEKNLYRTYKIKLPDGVDVNAAINKLKQSPYVEYAEPNYKVKVQAFPQTLPNDTYVNPSHNGTTWSKGAWSQAYEDMWGLKLIQADSAWAITQGQGIVVAVIDTGIDYTHPDIAANMWRNTDGSCGYNFVANNNNPMDDYGHGTHVAGTIAAIGNNSIGVIGVAPKAKIMAVKGIDVNGEGYTDVLAQCVTWAADNGANILSNSWGGFGKNQLLIDSFHYANSKGCICVAAAGNNSADVSDFCPANIDTVIAVSASDQDDQLCYFSNTGDKIEVSAPGGGYDTGIADAYNILSTMPDNCALASERPDLKISSGYWRLAGTSMACPHVSGLIALILSQHPNLSLEGVRDILHASADDVGDPGKDIYFGYGRINAYMATSLQISFSSASGNNFYHGVANVNGTASMTNPGDFYKYEVYYAPMGNPNQLTMITSSNTMVTDSVLGTWDTRSLDEGPQWLLVLKVTDKAGKIHTLTKEVVVDNVNKPPVFAPAILTVNKCAVIGRPLVFKVQATDPDDPAIPWGRLTYSASHLPPGATFDPATQIFSWQATDSNKGTYIVTFTVRDSQYVANEDVILTTVSIQEQEIGSSDKSIGNVRMYGNKIVWEQGSGEDICVYDIVKNTTIRLPWHLEHSADIYDDNIALFADGSLYLYNIPKNSHKKLVGFSAENPAQLSFYGNTIVYQNRSNPYSDIANEMQLYKLSAKKHSVIPNLNYFWGHLFKIYGDNVVFGDSDGLTWFVWLYNISTGNSAGLTVAGGGAYAAEPDIYDNKVVWSDIHPDIHLYYISSGTQTQITDNLAGWRPRIYKDRIVATDISTNNVKLYDIHAGEIDAHYCNDDSYLLDTAIYEDTIAYAYNDLSSDGSWHNGKIYMARLSFSPPINSILPAAPSKLTAIAGFANQITLTWWDNWNNETGFSLERKIGLKGSYAQIAVLASDKTTFTDTKLRPGITYYYRVRAYNASGYSAYSNEVSALLALPPSGLTASAISPTRIKLNWRDNSHNGAGFFVERIDGATGNSSRVGEVNPGTTTFTDQYVHPDIKYYYRVRAYNVSGCSAYSNKVSITTRAPIPAAPSGLTLSAMPSDLIIALGWKDNSNGEAFFTVERKTGYRGTYTVRDNKYPFNCATSFTELVNPGATYYYRVRAYNASGHSAYSNEISAITSTK